MTQAERRIRSLTIRGGDNDQLRQARYLLEDAFRIASLPGLPPNAMVLVRRLDLGTIHPGLSSVQLANTISERVRCLAAQAVCIDQQSGNDAGVVWFSDPLQPLQMLLQRLLDGGTADDWYWASLFPGFISGQGLNLNEALLGEVLLKACRTPLQGLAVARLIQTCLQPLRLSRLYAFLTPALVRRVLSEQGMAPLAASANPVQSLHRQVPACSDSRTEPRLNAPDLSLGWRSAIHSAVRRWGQTDVRSRWLAWQALLCHRPGWLERGGDWHRIELRYWLDSWSAASAADRGEAANGAGSGTLTGDALQSPSAMDSGIGLPHKPPALSPRLQSDRARSAGSALPASWADDNQQQPSVERPERFSPHAGFAFLIPLLQRLGLAELLRRHDVLLEADFPRQVLRTMAVRFGLDGDDPVWCLFDQRQQPPSVPIEHLCAPSPWRQLAQRATFRQRVPMPATPEQLSRTFQLVCALFLHRHCGMSLRGLIRRPGRVALSRSHWDVMFDLNQTDLRLRRQALDCDPGWVPWLGRVVQFHYHSEGQAYV